MKKVIQLVALLLAALFLLTACGDPTVTPNDDTTADTTLGDHTTTGGNDPETPPEEEKIGGTVVNVDPDILYYLSIEQGLLKDGEWDLTDLDKKVIAYFDDHYKDGGITDLLINIAGAAPFASDDPDLFDKIDKFNTTEENGTAVDYSTSVGVLSTYYIYTETDIDPFEMWFDYCRELGINPWISFRMNDVHYADETLGHSPFGYKARANGWLIGDSRFSYWLNNNSTAGSRYWYEYALDFSVQEVRDNFVKELDDRLSTYDVYGIELDWHRQIWCFPKDDIENCKYMNELMDKINEVVEKYEGIYGHDIKIAARINRDIDENMYFGFDTRYWAENDMIDVIIPSSYYGASDSDMPIAKWVEELDKYGVDIWAGLEAEVAADGKTHSTATLAAFSAQYYSQGAKKIYLFNMFRRKASSFNVCSSIENALAYEKRSYVVTESNCTPYGVKGIEPWDPLPKVIEVNAPYTIVINHGQLDYEKDVYVFVGAMGVEVTDIDEYLLTITYNGVECEFVGISTEAYVGERTDYGKVVAYKVPAEAVNSSIKGELVFDPGMNFTVAYVELMNGMLSE